MIEHWYWPGGRSLTTWPRVCVWLRARLDLDKTETLFDMRQHKAAVSSLQFRSKRHLYSASRDGHLCLYDAQQNFAVVAVVHVDANLPQHAWGPSGGDEHLTLATSPEHSVGSMRHESRTGQSLSLLMLRHYASRL